MRITSHALPIAALAFWLLGRSMAFSATIEYRILINGSSVGHPFLLHDGPHTLTVLGRVHRSSDNEGGFLQTSIEISDSANVIVWKEGVGFLGAGTGSWVSTPNPSMSVHLPGLLRNKQVFAETSQIPAAEWESKWQDVGYDGFDVIARGDFYFPYGPIGETWLTVTGSIWENMIARREAGGVIAVAAEAVSISSWRVRRYVPEPSSYCLAVLAALACVSRHRRRLSLC